MRTTESLVNELVSQLLEDFGHTNPTRRGLEITHGCTSDCCGAAVLAGGYCADCGDHCECIDDDAEDPKVEPTNK